MHVGATNVYGLLLLSLLTCLTLTSGAPGSPLDQEWTNYVDAPPRSTENPVSLRSLMKSLFRFNLLRKPEVEELPNSGLLTDTATTPEGISSIEAELISSISPPLVDDTPDLWHIPAHLERDKSHKFTHSFRFGYGALH
ncbi:uncharacterized protein LOC124360232 [Homalodisca vitripennis]|uniref:uncharacterized protein LOC124360232 n=1 Tax=Homalodisca vitripennis TaxID=197043 RepID=UPI001EEA3D3C|nr:uncharacterized protein LOC124360232 [Homalodisca vitripennis]